MIRPARIAVVAFAIVAISGHAIGAPRALVLDASRSSISFTLDATAHTVEGTFAPPSGRLLFDDETGAASGSVVVDLTSGRTGSERRDRKMHGDVLETSTYPSAAFRAQRITGAVARVGASEIAIAGVLEFHGSEHPVTVPVTVHVAGENVSAEAELSIPYVAWGLEDPSFLFLRVAKEVAVHLKVEGVLSAPSP